jgi:hypothetical protein
LRLACSAPVVSLEVLEAEEVLLVEELDAERL